jgi:ABC-type nitrate/sulfonate/bicarbonate transport system substrate-binding protein
MNKATGARVRICTFKGLQNLAMYAAQEQGIFAAYDLDVEIEYTSGSKPQLAGLARGEYDLIQTAPDNVVNFDNNPAAFGMDASTAPRIVMVSGGSVGPLSVYAQQAIHSIADLRGAVLGVDNPTSGFALVMRDLLAREGLELERDYTFTVAGGTSTRLDSLIHGTVAATILYAPFDVIAHEKGFSTLAVSTDFYPAYASLAIAATQNWIETHSDVLMRYITAIRQALRWLYETKNVGQVETLMVNTASLGLDAELAKRTYAAFVDPVTGFGIEGKLDEAGLQQVITIRAQYAGTEANTVKGKGQVADYLDMRWYQQVSWAL